MWIALESAVGFLGLGLALILENPIHVLLPVERHADLPGLREDFWILNGDLILKGVSVEERVSLDQVQRLMRVAKSPVEFTLLCIAVRP